jgi:pentapeptide MXKDX repeat protein
MKKISYVLAALLTVAVVAPSIARAEDRPMMRRGMHREHMHREHMDRPMMHRREHREHHMMKRMMRREGM